jgi:hypothetical protein
MRKIIIILLTVSAYFFNLNCCEGHWLFPNGDRVTHKEHLIVDCFRPQNITDTRFECSVCGCLLSIPEWSSTGAISRELRNHLETAHPERIQLIDKLVKENLKNKSLASAQPSSRLPKKAGSAKLTGQ